MLPPLCTRIVSRADPGLLSTRASLVSIPKLHTHFLSVPLLRSMFGGVTALSGWLGGNAKELAAAKLAETKSAADAAVERLAAAREPNPMNNNQTMHGMDDSDPDETETGVEAEGQPPLGVNNDNQQGDDTRRDEQRASVWCTICVCGVAQKRWTHGKRK